MLRSVESMLYRLPEDRLQEFEVKLSTFITELESVVPVDESGLTRHYEPTRRRCHQGSALQSGVGRTESGDSIGRTESEDSLGRTESGDSLSRTESRDSGLGTEESDSSGIGIEHIAVPVSGDETSRMEDHIYVRLAVLVV